VLVQRPIRTAATPTITVIVMVEACIAVRNAVLLSADSWSPGGPFRACLRRGYGSTEIGSDAVGLAPSGVLLVTLVVVTSMAESPLPTVKPWLALSWNWS
jgi:hypothetical protein